MGQYAAPLRDIQFVLHELLGVENHLKEMLQHTEIDADTISQVIEEAGKLCSEVIFPLNQSDDHGGCTYHGDGVVTAPKDFKEAYQRYVEADWPSLGYDPEYGGQGLSILINNTLYKILNSTNQARTMYPGLSHGTYEALHAHSIGGLKQRYLPKLVSDTWIGTMCLTEPHCDTDLGILRIRVESLADGSYVVTGTKISISADKYDLAEDIIRLVLARLPNAPGDTKGVSLFMMPKFIPDANGSPDEHNTMKCGSIEHEMGIHGNATCVTNLDGARSWMVGEPSKGLSAMFVMMSTARLDAGMQSLGLAEVAYQDSATYVKERLQTRSLSGPEASGKPADPIIVHPDVRRMLLTQRAFAEGGRVFSYWIALQIDRELSHSDESARKDATNLVALLTPITKAFLNDNVLISTNESIQVFGGHSHVAERGMEQYVRDARINMIYEGTNTVQSLDLLGRKIFGGMGVKMKKLGKLVQDFVGTEDTDETMQEFINPLADIGDKVQKLTMEIDVKAMANPDEVGAAAVPYLRVVGHLVFSYFWARMTKITLEKQGSGNSFYKVRLAMACFYFAKLLPETASQTRIAHAGGATLMALEADLF